jgi:hypothetical protein
MLRQMPRQRPGMCPCRVWSRRRQTRTARPRADARRAFRAPLAEYRRRRADVSLCTEHSTSMPSRDGTHVRPRCGQVELHTARRCGTFFTRPLSSVRAAQCQWRLRLTTGREVDERMRQRLLMLLSAPRCSPLPPPAGLGQRRDAWHARDAQDGDAQHRNAQHRNAQDGNAKLDARYPRHVISGMHKRLVCVCVCVCVRVCEGESVCVSEC